MSLPERRSAATTAIPSADWSIDRANQYYNVNGWGAGFFSINDKGHVVVHPMGQPGPVIDLMDVVEDIRERKIGFPCVVRFQDVLRARVKQINEAFGKAIAAGRRARTAVSAATRAVPRRSACHTRRSVPGIWRNTSRAPRTQSRSDRGGAAGGREWGGRPTTDLRS